LFRFKSLRSILVMLAVTVGTFSTAAQPAAAHPSRDEVVAPATTKGNAVARNNGGYNDRPRWNVYQNGTDWISNHHDIDHSRNAARQFSKNVRAPSKTGAIITISCNYTLNVPWWAPWAFDVLSAVTVVGREDDGRCW
jgi:hypothetical protein